MGKPMAFAAAVCLLVALSTVTAGGAQMKLSSPAFRDNGDIPEKYSCTGEQVNPELKVEGIPQDTKTLALIVYDPDAPGGMFVHWVVYNIPASASDISENSVPGIQGKNGMQENGYAGMCPPAGTHRYFFTVYALDTELELEQSAADKRSVEQAMEGHVLGSARLMGKFSHR
jgi:Raf kinase inhibitor-like YbhB/YbcL family protein